MNKGVTKEHLRKLSQSYIIMELIPILSTASTLEESESIINAKCVLKIMVN